MRSDDAGDRYWEAFGAVRKALLDILDRRDAAFKAAIAFAKVHGTPTILFNNGSDFSFMLSFTTPPDSKVWRSVKGVENGYLPRKINKEGRALAEEIDKIERSSPGGIAAANAIGQDFLYGGRWSTPGVWVRRKRVLVRTPAWYTSPKKLAKDIRRISDLVFEKLVEAKAR